MCQSLFSKKETLAQVFSCEFCENSKNAFFTEHLWTTASNKGTYKDFHFHISLTLTHCLLRLKFDWLLLYFRCFLFILSQIFLPWTLHNWLGYLMHAFKNNWSIQVHKCSTLRKSPLILDSLFKVRLVLLTKKLQLKTNLSSKLQEISCNKFAGNPAINLQKIQNLFSSANSIVLGKNWLQ